MSEPRYIVAGTKPWNRRVFNQTIRALPGSWHLVDHKEQLTPRWVAEFDPRFIFFLHWSWIVPADLTSRYACVGFHMTDLPYGRGGSPLQNLILRGHRTTKLTAFRLAPELDAGPVLLKEELSLDGTAEAIYARATELAAGMIERIITDDPPARDQEGQEVVFARRKPEASRIPRLDSLEALYDFIRMLDAEGYPHAFLVDSGFRYEFRRAAIDDGRIAADVCITLCEDAEA